jgi:hypothetical protein
MFQLGAVVLAFISVFIATPEALSSTCANQSKVQVIAEDDHSAEIICEASTLALSILAQYDLIPRRQIIIEVINQGIDHLGYKAFGSYDIRKDQIQIMSYNSILENYSNPTMYDEPFDRIHYSGAVAHEITHAVFHHNSTAEAPGPAPQEYLAHAIQLSSLPEARRNRVIQSHDELAWMSGDTLSDIYMALEPGRFAVKSYKHLTTMNNPKTFIEILLNAKWFYVDIP